jgi:beta-lactamase class A
MYTPKIKINIKNQIFLILLFAIHSIALVSCKIDDKKVSNEVFIKSLDSKISEIEGDVALAFYNISNQEEIFINTNEKFHAASTMKVPVMIELYKQAALNKINLQDSILLKNEFKSIVDGSLYSMDIASDGDDIIYSQIGTKVSINYLIYQMITVSSNLATNVLIDMVNAKNVTLTMQSLGADKIEVLRGVEDIKAFELGLSNSTTANDLLEIMKAIAMNKAGSEKDCKQMISILKDQIFNEIIPKYLPKEVSVAHKTGSITGVHHDAGIVYLPNGESYVLILLSKNLKDFEKGTDQLAKISESIYNYVNNN